PRMRREGGARSSRLTEAPSTLFRGGAGGRRVRLRRAGVAAPGFARRLIDPAHSQLDFAAVVQAHNLYLPRVADLDDIRSLADALLRQFADVDKPVARAEEVHEGAEIDDLHDLADIDHALLGFGDDALDPVDRGLCRFGGGCGDLDRAVVVDVD